MIITIRECKSKGAIWRHITSTGRADVALFRAVRKIWGSRALRRHAER